MQTNSLTEIPIFPNTLLANTCMIPLRSLARSRFGGYAIFVF